MGSSDDTETGLYRTLPEPPTDGRPEAVSTRTMVDVAGRSDRGRVRANNEDHFLVARLDRLLEVLTTNLPPGVVPNRFGELAYGMVVADGMGGAAAGEEASRTAIATLVNLVLHTPDWIMRVGEHEADALIERIIDRYRQVGIVLAERVAADPTLAGMGTTLTLACSSGPDLFIGHVGDSRAYLVRGSELIRLTRDHTYPQDLADRGLLRPDEVARHRLRHVLTRVLGGRTGEDPVPVDVVRVGLADGDQLLLCTDGLYDVVPESDMAAALVEAGTAAEACDRLIAVALGRGAPDNVTAVVARYHIPDEPG